LVSYRLLLLPGTVFYFCRLLSRFADLPVLRHIIRFVDFREEGVVREVIVWLFFAIMAPIDLNKNKDAILKAHKEVSDPKSQTNW